MASSSTTAPPATSGVRAAAMAPRSTARLYRAARRMPLVNALRVDRDGSVLRITLARPDRRNAFDAQLIDELSKAFIDVGRARAVVLAGEGASFCAGADVEWMRASVGLSVDDRKSTRLNSSHLVISYAVFFLKTKNSCTNGDLLSIFGKSAHPYQFTT